MAESSLSDAMKALELGDKRGTRNGSKTHPIKNKAARKSENKSSSKQTAQTTPPGERGKGSPTKPPKPSTTATQTNQAGASSTDQPLNKKGRPRRPRKRGSSKTNPPAGFQTSQQKQEETQPDSSKVDDRPSFVYIVQASLRNGEDIMIGVYTSISKANEAAFDHVVYGGMPRASILNITSSFGQNARGLATRREWPNGASEILIPSYDCPVERIKVLPKEFPSFRQNKDLETVYLSLDGIRRLFVIGAHPSKQEAWEACRKYWLALSYSTPIENMEQWFDDDLLFHADGKIGDRMHHWFVRRCGLDAIAYGSASK